MTETKFVQWCWQRHMWSPLEQFPQLENPTNRRFHITRCNKDGVNGCLLNAKMQLLSHHLIVWLFQMTCICCCQCRGIVSVRDLPWTGIFEKFCHASSLLMNRITKLNKLTQQSDVGERRRIDCSWARRHTKYCNSLVHTTDKLLGPSGLGCHIDQHFQADTLDRLSGKYRLHYLEYCICWDISVIMSGSDWDSNTYRYGVLLRFKRRIYESNASTTFLHTSSISNALRGGNGRFMPRSSTIGFSTPLTRTTKFPLPGWTKEWTGGITGTKKVSKIDVDAWK